MAHVAQRGTITQNARRRALLTLALLLFLAPHAFAQTPPAPPAEVDSSRLQTSASISATPNPVPAGVGAGTTKITWRTGDGADGQVFVSEDNAAEKIFASGPDGSSDAPWIGNGSTYVFRLYSTGEKQVLLASVEVRGTSEVAREESVAPLVWKAVAGRRLYLFVLLPVLFAAAWYVSREEERGRKKSETILAAAAILATAFTLFPILFAESRPFQDQPFPDAHENADAALQLVRGQGFVTYIYDNSPRPPRSPPGFALALAPFAAFGNYPSNVQVAPKVFAAFYVLAAVFAAWSLGGPLAAALAATLVGASPFARTAATLVMSDALGAAATVLFLLLLGKLSAGRVYAAGALAGVLVALRLPLLVNLVALFVALPWKWCARAMMCAAPALAALGVFNWATFGSPLKTGYSYWLPGLKSFSWGYAFLSPPRGDGPYIISDALRGLLLRGVCPCPVGGAQAAISNVFFYPAVLFGLFWTFAPPLVTLCGLFYLWKHRRESTARFTVTVVALSLPLFTFYFHQGTRFMSAPATLLLVFSSVGIARWAESKVGLTRKGHPDGNARAGTVVDAEGG